MFSTLILAAAVAAQPAGPAKPTAPDLPAKGQKIAVSAARGTVPALRSAGDYREFLGAVGREDTAAIKASWPGKLLLLGSGQVVTVVGTELPAASGRRTPPNPPSEGEGSDDPAGVPAVLAEVSILGKSEIVRIPAVYFPAAGGGGRRGAGRFPSLIESIDHIVPVPGLEMVIWWEHDWVAVARGYFEFVAMMKAVRAADAVGIEEMGQRGRMALVASGTRILVIQRHVNVGLTGEDAAECRATRRPDEGSGHLGPGGVDGDGRPPGGLGHRGEAGRRAGCDGAVDAARSDARRSGNG